MVRLHNLHGLQGLRFRVMVTPMVDLLVEPEIIIVPDRVL